MSLTQVKLERLLVPAHAHYGSGVVADHNVKTDDKMQDSNNRPTVSYVEVLNGRILYTKETDFNKLSDAEKAKASYVFDESSIKRYKELDAVRDYKVEKVALTDDKK